MIDLQAVRNAYSAHEISNIGFLRGPNNPADGLTKIAKCPALVHLLRTGKCNFKIDQWILRYSDTNPAQTAPYVVQYDQDLDLSITNSTEEDVHTMNLPQFSSNSITHTRQAVQYHAKVKVYSTTQCTTVLYSKVLSNMNPTEHSSAFDRHPSECNPAYLKDQKIPSGTCRTQIICCTPHTTHLIHSSRRIYCICILQCPHTRTSEITIPEPAPCTLSHSYNVAAYPATL